MPDCRQPKAFRKRFERTGWAVYCLLREEKMTLQTKRAALAAVLAAGLAVTTLAGCNRDTAAPAGEASGGASGAAAGKRACIILPDAASSSRWENGDRPQLEKAFKAQGVETDIQNAQNDTSKYATIAQQQLTKGCAVMLLVDLNKAGVQVAQKAKAQGVPVIAYDRPIKGADYYISFDNFHVGELEGQMIVDGLKAEGKDPATAKVIYVGGDPTDGNAKQFHDGADKVMAAAGIKPAFETPGSWDAAKGSDLLRAGIHRAKGRHRRRLGRQRLQRGQCDLGARQERQEGSGQRPGREPARSAEHPARQAGRDGLQAVPARGAGQRGPGHEAAQRREAARPDNRPLTARRSSHRRRSSSTRRT